MRILQTLQWVKFAGTEKVCVDLCNKMSKEHEVYLLTNKKDLPCIENSVILIEFDFYVSRYNLLYLSKLAKLLQKVRPDIIHCHNTKVIEMTHYAQFFFKKKIPIIATKHDLTKKKKYNLADLSVGILSNALEILPKNSIIIENGMRYIEPKPKPKIEKFHIISSGRLAYDKGHQNLLKALTYVDFDFQLDIFGEGSYKNELVSLVEELDLKKKVRFCGFAENIQDYLASCDLQVIPSLIEPYGLVTIDGIYYAPLLISSKTGVAAEILPQELLFMNEPNALGAKLCDIYQNYEDYIEKFAHVQAKRDIFSIQKVMNKYIEAYKMLIKKYQ